jgi:glycogen synthase
MSHSLANKMPTPLRLLLVSNLYPPDVLGGYELLARDVTEGLVARGHHVTVLTSGGGDTRGGVHRTLRLARNFDAPAGRDRLRHRWIANDNERAVKRLLQAEPRPDAALVMSLRRLGPAPLRALARAHVPAVVTVNDDWPVAHAEAPAPRGFSPRALAGWLLDRLPGTAHTFRGVPIRNVLYLSGAIRNEVRAANVPFPVGAVRAQGVDTRLFCPRPGVTFEPKTVLFVGRLHPSKAPDVAIDAIAALRARGHELRLTLAGAPVTEAYGDELRARAVEKGVADRVTFLGAIDRRSLPDLYRRAEIALFLTRWEGEAQGLVPLEAMGCGALVVSFVRGGAREFLGEDRATIEAATLDGEGLADAMVRALEEPGLRDATLARAMHLLRDRGSLDGYLDALESALLSARSERNEP